MKKLFTEFYKTNLNDQDLNEFKIILNKFYIETTEKSNTFYALKDKYANRQITKEELQKARLEYRAVKNEFAKVTQNNAFKINLNNARNLLKAAKKTKAAIDIQKAQEEYVIAKHLYDEAKLVIKEKGRGASLAKVSENALEVRHLSFKYSPDFPYALKDVNFDIKHGEYVTIIGHNGSGKSTLSKLLIGVLSAEEGDIKVFGNLMTKNNLDQIRRFLGIVFQNPDNQFIGSTVEADIAFGLENKRVNPEDMREIIIEAASKVRMENFLDKEPLNLSGGQKQRVAIASTLALNPDIIIFDEATSMLDPKGNREIKEIMVELRNTGLKTIISITHDMDEILNADKVIVMNGGRLEKMGTPEEILKDKEYLRSRHLDIPFLATVEEALENVGVKVQHSKNMDELVKQICKK
ncbi:energy-coupling factor transporter ATPase [Mesoplasma syrphidae]|uniref:Energy-coupling factor transporter ATPase n=1 Tax=Mesoplasma syrphidae TaxID=225999 RepID=A0A2K9BMR5_9MOLU|nr:energy-coupling factor transporter ATPase [Mesoplasma syrphidae]AUF83333.1 energy-coupling factor transporter ATPase [Mesoplasma syrphidae]